VVRLSQPRVDMQHVIGPPRLDGGVPWPGETIAGRYLVDGLCARRGPAIVLRASRLPAGGHVAIEVLEPEQASHGLLVEQFLREGEAAMRIRGEHAVRVLDEGRLESGAPYLVLEYVEGPTLEEVASQWGRLPVPAVIDWMLQAMEAIAQAHSFGVVHGELTLDKMLLVRDHTGSPCIKVDFGQRKMTWESVSGAVSSAAPGDVDARPDVRALGVALLRLLFPPAAGAAAPRTSVPLDLEVAARRCVAERPDRAFASVAELARALAPFGTAAALASCEHIEDLLEDCTFELTRRKRRPELPEPSPDHPEARRKRPYVAPASGQVVLLALVMLVALGAAAFTAMYRSVHGDEATPSVDGTEVRPTSPNGPQPQPRRAP